MKKISLILTLLLSAPAFAFEFPLEITEYIDDVKIIAYIKQSDIDLETRWTPFKNTPPLSIDDALSNVQNFIKGEIDFTDVTLTGIELKPIPGRHDYWHYLVKLKYMLDKNIKSSFFVVLMDGKVIPAIENPDFVR